MLDEPGDPRRNERPHQRGAGRAVVKVGPILATLHEVADVVQEGGDDDLVVGTVLMREGGALQRVGELGDRIRRRLAARPGEETDEVEARPDGSPEPPSRRADGALAVQSAPTRP